MNFRLVTVHGEVEALVDHAFKDGELVGRYHLFSVSMTATGDAESKELWCMLFDGNGHAIWHPDGPYEWKIPSSQSGMSMALPRLVLTLLWAMQERMRRY